MVYRGHVRNGKVELETDVALPEGAEVELTVHSNGRNGGDHRPIEEILEEIGSGIPASEWERLPPDLTDQLDHYVYGTPKT